MQSFGSPRTAQSALLLFCADRSHGVPRLLLPKRFAGSRMVLNAKLSNRRSRRLKSAA